MHAGLPRCIICYSVWLSEQIYGFVNRGRNREANDKMFRDRKLLKDVAPVVHEY